jgi:phage tail-like protein
MVDRFQRNIMATLSQNNTLLSAFNFKAVFEEIPDVQEQLFQEISGLSWEVETEDVPIGGVNGYNIRLPKRIRYQNLVFKRSMMTDSALTKWMDETIQNYFISPINPMAVLSVGVPLSTNILITLMNGDGEDLVKWQVIQAFPLKWNLAPFNAMENKFVVETLEFGFQSFKRV